MTTQLKACSESLGQERGERVSWSLLDLFGSGELCA